MTQAHGHSDHQALQQRYQTLFQSFQQQCQVQQVDFVARAPGRINIIGEHIDYSYFSVFPFAVAQDTIIAVKMRPDSKELRVCNVNPAFETHVIDVTQDIIIDKSKHSWMNYVLCGVKGIAQALNLEHISGMDWIVHGVVPAGAGMSSSSALVCASAMAMATAHKSTLSNSEIAEICQRAERWVGTESGGMDQAISMLGEAGCAKRIDFHPLNSTTVKLPSGCAWVVTNSLVESHKQVSGARLYNKRVVECRLGCILLAKLFGVNDWENMYPYRRLKETLGFSFEQMIERAQALMPEEGLTVEQIEALLGGSIDKFTSGISTIAAVLAANTHFYLKSRTLHVFSESHRVFRFQEICESGADETKLKDLGALMCQSHESCDKLYDCSCPELNELQQTCVQAGAYGSRLTGAGWGGCAISLVPIDKLDSFFAHVREHYYSKLPSLPADESSYMFATAPANGARSVVFSSL